LDLALILVSSSGTSRNVVALAERARAIQVPVVALTGFSGGILREIACAIGVSIHVDSEDYETVEPVHDALLHRIQFHFRRMGE
jgi:D-sedoheptulose 7-phosphate isomerase/D-glycero-D-manno-heptose 1,7-bisphosphate phosphatase